MLDWIAEADKVLSAAALTGAAIVIACTDSEGTGQPDRRLARAARWTITIAAFIGLCYTVSEDAVLRRATRAGTRIEEIVARCGEKSRYRCVHGELAGYRRWTKLNKWVENHNSR